MFKRVLSILLLLSLALPVLAQDSSVDLVCGQSTIDGAEPGVSFTATCPAGCSAGSIWGTDTYTDDSDICTAAAHAGVIDLADGGTFTIEFSGEQDAYPASTQNGIESYEWGYWDVSFGFGTSSSALALTCGQSSIDGVEAGDTLTVTCPAGCSAGSIWGTDTYTNDSNICTAAAHAGVIDLADGGTFDITYVDGIENHPASEQNGISSSSWGSWSLSFTFDMASPSALALTCGQSSIDGAEAGDTLTVTCPAGCSAGSIWGTDVYTNDSDICTAAAHAGVIDLADGGTFDITYVDGIEDHPASEQNGISSSSWGSWSLSFTFESPAYPIEWDTAAQSLEGETGTYGLVSCPANGTEGFIWGTDIYSDDSSICTAAVHAGLITLEDGGIFTLSIVDGQESYEASERNGIASNDWPSWSRSFVVTAEETEIEWSTNAQKLLGPTGTTYHVSCPAKGTASSIWGTIIYSDDSSVCTAAVHAGLITLEEGGKFVATIADGQESYEATEANGISSSNWSSWGRSFVVDQ